MTSQINQYKKENKSDVNLFTGISIILIVALITTLLIDESIKNDLRAENERLENKIKLLESFKNEVCLNLLQRANFNGYGINNITAWNEWKERCIQ